MRLRLYILIYLLTSFRPLAHAVADSSSLLHFNLRSGFPSNNVYSVIQDRNNYLWFATDYGLVKYNGYDIKTYNTTNGSLPSDDVYEMFEDSRGRLWLKSFDSKLGYIKNGVFKNITYHTENRVLRSLYFSECGNIFYFLDVWGYYSQIVVVNDDVIKVIPLPFEFNAYGKKIFATRITLADNFKINIWTRDLELYEWDYRLKGHLRFISTYPQKLRDSYAYGFFVSPDNKIYKGNMDSDEVYYFDPLKKLFKTFAIRQAGGDKTEKLFTYNAKFYSGNYSRNTAVFSNTHMYIVDTNFNFTSRLKFTDIVPTNKQIVYRLTDGQGQMWYTTKGDGAWFKPSFYNFYAQRKRIPEIQNAGYLGSIGNTSFWWDKMKLEMYELVDNEKVRAIKFKKGIELKAIAGNDSLAYISTSDGMYKFDRKRNTVLNTMDKYTFRLTSKVADPEDSSAVRQALDMMHETRNTTLVGDDLYSLIGNGYVRLSFRTDTGFLQHIGQERYSDVFHDVQGQKLYLHSNHKILVTSLTQNTSRELNPELIKKSGINNVRQLVKDKFGNIFIIGDTHLYLYNEQTETLAKVNTDFSVSNSRLALRNNELFIAGKFGIAMTTVTGKGKLGRFSILPNMVSDRYNRIESFVINANHSGILNTDVDCYSFSIDSLRKYALESNGSGFFFLVMSSPLEKKITGNDTFRYGQSESQIKLDAINSFGKGSLKFSYRINTASKWEASASGEVFLGNLSPGKFHKVECIVSDQLWVSKIHTFYIYRTPYWWQTATARVIFWASGILLLLIIIFVAVIVTRRYVARKEEKRRALTELELRAIHSQINPHFIFNTLSTALFFINKKRFDDAYAHVSKFSKLLRAYLKSSQDRYVVLGEEIVMLRNYIELQQVRFDERFEFDIKVDNKLPVNNIQIPSLLLQPLVENAINHGLFHSETRGYLDIRFLQGTDSTEMICIIEDNGVGRDAATRINAESSTKESYGTKLTTKLLEVFKQYEHLDIKLEYTDKKAPESGTIVTLTLKNLKYIT